MTEPLCLNLSLLLEKLCIPSQENITQAQRIFHGRGHAYKNLEHITIDLLDPLILITLFAPVSNTDLALLVKELSLKFTKCKSIQVQHRYHKSWEVDCIFGSSIHQLEILENDLKYKLEIKSGANTGLFLDMKNGRNWIQQNSKDKHVLNLFSYTCGFSVAALAGGAKSVFNIDMSSPFLNIGRENHRINNLCLDTIRFEKLNIIKSFGRIKKQAPYDLIICDPPTFQKGSIDLSRDYPKLIRRLKDFVSDKGFLVLCINTPNIGSLTGREFLIKILEEEASGFELIDEIKPPDVYVETQNKGTKTLVYKKRL